MGTAGAAAWMVVDYWQRAVELRCLDCGYWFMLPAVEAVRARWCPQCGQAPLAKPDSDLQPG